MDNKAIANILYETADLLEIDGQDSFRIRSYRNAAQAIENHSQQIKELIADPKQVLAIPGIGKSMLRNLQELFTDGKLSVQAELLEKYHPSMLQLLKIQGLGPKTIALIWSAYKVSDVDGVEKLAREGKIRELPRMGEKHEAKLLKAIEDYRRISGRFLIDAGETEAEKLTDYLEKYPGIDKITPAGSLRRGRETVGDLDILVTGKACTTEEGRQKAIAYVAQYPPLMDVIASGDNKISFHLRSGMQVDVRLLPPESFGAAMQYFTGSKAHNVALRQRALKMGYTLNEYSLATLEGEKPVAGKTEEEIYAKLKLDYIPPEMRENLGEIDLAQTHALPPLITQAICRATSTCTPSKPTARTRSKKWPRPRGRAATSTWPSPTTPRTWPSPTDSTTSAPSSTSRAFAPAGKQIGRHHDLCRHRSRHPRRRRSRSLRRRARANGSRHRQRALGLQSGTGEDDRPPAQGHRESEHVDHRTSHRPHPTAPRRLPFDMHAVLTAAAKHKVAMELNSYPDRLDLNDVHLRQAKQQGVKIVINTDSHHTSHMEKIRYGILQARRAWLTKDDVLNTLPAQKFAKAMKHAW